MVSGKNALSEGFEVPEVTYKIDCIENNFPGRFDWFGVT